MERSNWPFALFAVVDLDPGVISRVLDSTKRAKPQIFWLASQDYNDAPKKRPNVVNNGTPTPIADNFKSPWVGKPVEDLLKWLQAKPVEADLNFWHFAILDQGAKAKEPTIVVGRVGNHALEGDHIYLLRHEASYAATFLIGSNTNDFDELTKDGKMNAEINYGRRHG